MPTIVTRYVDTRSPAGGNGTTPSTGSGDANRAYRNLSASLAAESASRGDLVARDEILKIECAGGLDTGSNDYTPTFISDYDRYLWITVNSSSKHQGVWDTSKYTIATVGNNPRVFNINNTRVMRFEGLQIENRANNGVWSIFNLTDSVTQDRELVLIDCHVRSISGSGNQGSAVSYPYILRKSLVLVNNIFHGNFEHVFRNDYASSGSRPTIFHNNTVFGARTGSLIRNIGPLITHSLYNNIIQVVSNGVGIASSSGMTIFSGSNITSDNSSFEPAFRNITIQFVNTSSGDFRLVDKSSPAVNTGTNLSNNILYPITTDIAGNIRGVGASGRQWDIGALEYQRPATVIQSGSSVRGNITITSTGTRGQVIGSNTW